MPRKWRDYLYRALMLAAAALLMIGGVLFHAADSFEAYISALLIVALASVGVVSALELRPKTAKGSAYDLAGEEGPVDQQTAANER